MKAVRFYGPGDVRREETEKPVPGPEEVLIRVRYAGICGSDLHIYRKGMFVQNIPEIMGHEFSGEVEEAGSGITDLRRGDAVTADPTVTCGSCESCRGGRGNTCSELGFIGEVRPGCFAEYICLPREKVIPLAPGSDLKQAALTEPLAVALNICERARLRSSDNIAVIGAGPIGLLTVLLARELYHVSRIVLVGRSSGRLRIGERIGADAAHTSLPKEEKYEKVIEAAGKAETVNLAISHTLPGGGVYEVSVFEDAGEIDLNTLVQLQISLIGCNAYERRHLEQAAGLITDGRVDVRPLISGTCGFSECKEAFAALNGKDKKAVKILFDAEK